jgi:hypothetical protein
LSVSHRDEDAVYLKYRARGRPGTSSTPSATATRCSPAAAGWTRISSRSRGYDPGEAVNTEEVIVLRSQGGRTALVSYGNRVTEVNAPPLGAD